MDLASIVLAPVRVPVRIAQALDDLATLADKAREDPQPAEEVRDRIDKLLAELRELNALAKSLIRTAQAVDITGRDIVLGGQELTATSKALDVTGREIVTGGEDLTEVSRVIAADLETFRAALPRLLQGLDTVEELEEAVEVVADTVEPLQQTAERVGRVTRRLSRRPD